VELKSGYCNANEKGGLFIGCSCIIPFYNEGTRISKVLNVLKDVIELSQIICVDDGSEDFNSVQLLLEHPNINLLRLEKNRGKTEAVKAGLKLVKNNYVLLLDADLDALNNQEISKAVKTITSQSNLDMIILRRVNAGIHSKLNRGDILYAGERILKSDDLKKILVKPAKSYQLEVLINKYMKDNQRKVYWMPSSARNTYKFKKLGLMAGLKAELEMINQIMACHGPKEYFDQYRRFALYRLPEGKKHYGI